MIIVKDVYKIYKSGSIKQKVETVALKGVSLEINKGDFIAIMGPSGSGKSTLLNILGGLDSPSAGEIIFTVDGKNHSLTAMSEDELDEFRQGKFGIVFQANNLIPHLTAVENVELPLKFLGRKNTRQKAKELMIKLGMEHRMHHRINQLSGGEKQRVALASALIYNPRIILADEPTGELDHANVKQVMTLFKEIQEQEGITFFVVTHNPEVASYAKRFFSIYDGTLTELANINNFQEIHSDSGKYMLSIDKLGRINIPTQLLSEIQVIDDIVGYTINECKLKIFTYNEGDKFLQLDSKNRVKLPEIRIKDAITGFFDINNHEIVINLKEDCE